ncbi:MAG: S-layer homology domain-containing protein, partial [Lachnospiraceae bacterium]|nr:S-layer homology domain-containing protein [Lachnospiraceae bacterium]
DGYYKAVMWAYENKIVNGTSATTFSPKDACKRSQMTTLLWKMAGKPEPEGGITTVPFTDVRPSDGFYKSVVWAYSAGITKGTSATTFSPKKGCTRAEFVTFIYRFSKLMNGD